MTSYASTHFIETLTTLIDERIELALTSITTTDTDGWLTPKEAAQYIRSPRSRIYELKAQGRLTPAYDGRLLKFRRSDLDEYLQRKV